MKKIVGILVILIIISGVILTKNYDHKIEFLGDTYSKTIEKLDLNDKNLENTDWIDDLALFSNLKEVNMLNKDLSKTTIDTLKTKYPKVNFLTKKIYSLYGLELEENITDLDLSRVDIDDKLIDNLSLFPNLNKVNLKNHKLTLKTQSELVKKYSQIEFAWDIYFQKKLIDSNTKKLNVAKQKLNKEEFIYLLDVLKDLNHLDMSDTNFTNEELGNLREKYPHINIVWKLYMGKWSLKTDDVSFSVLVRKIDYKRLTNEDIKVLKYCTNLKALDLGHQDITDISVIGEYLKDLRILILADNKITDISPIVNLKHLHYVELFVNKIKDMSPLAKCEELVDINIGYNPIETIKPLLNFKKLERIWIVCGNLTEKDRVTLKNAYPNSTVNTAWALTSTGSGWRTHTRYYEMKKMYNNPKYLSEEFMKLDS